MKRNNTPTIQSIQTLRTLKAGILSTQKIINRIEKALITTLDGNRKDGMEVKLREFMDAKLAIELQIQEIENPEQSGSSPLYSSSSNVTNSPSSPYSPSESAPITNTNTEHKPINTSPSAPSPSSFVSSSSTTITSTPTENESKIELIESSPEVDKVPLSLRMDELDMTTRITGALKKMKSCTSSYTSSSESLARKIQRNEPSKAIERAEKSKDVRFDQMLKSKKVVEDLTAEKTALKQEIELYENDGKVLPYTVLTAVTYSSDTYSSSKVASSVSSPESSSTSKFVETLGFFVIDKETTNKDVDAYLDSAHATSSVEMNIVVTNYSNHTVVHHMITALSRIAESQLSGCFDNIQEVRLLGMINNNSVDLLDKIVTLTPNVDNITLISDSTTTSTQARLYEYFLEHTELGGTKVFLGGTVDYPVITQGEKTKYTTNFDKSFESQMDSLGLNITINSDYCFDISIDTVGGDVDHYE